MFLVYDPGSGIKWLDVSSSGAGAAAYSPGGLGGDDEIHTLYFRNILLYFGEASMLPGEPLAQYLIMVRRGLTILLHLLLSIHGDLYPHHLGAMFIKTERI